MPFGDNDLPAFGGQDQPAFVPSFGATDAPAFGAKDTAAFPDESRKRAALDAANAKLRAESAALPPATPQEQAGAEAIISEMAAPGVGSSPPPGAPGAAGDAVSVAPAASSPPSIPSPILYTDVQRRTVQPEDGTQIGKGFEAGLNNTVALFSNAVAAGAKLVGAGDAQVGAEAFAEEFRQEAMKYAGKNPTIESVINDPNAFDAALNWALWNIGQGGGTSIPVLVATLATGGWGGVAAGYGMGVGDLHGIQREAADSNSAVTFGLAVPYALIERVGAPFQLGKKLIGEGGKGIVRGVGKAMLGEATAEGVQTGLGVTAEALAQGRPITEALADPENLKQIGESAAAGAIAGGPFGAVPGTRQDTTQEPSEQGQDAQEAPEAVTTPEAPETAPSGPEIAVPEMAFGQDDARAFVPEGAVPAETVIGQETAPVVEPVAEEPAPEPDVTTPPETGIPAAEEITPQPTETAAVEPEQAPEEITPEVTTPEPDVTTSEVAEPVAALHSRIARPVLTSTTPLNPEAIAKAQGIDSAQAVLLLQEMARRGQIKPVTSTKAYDNLLKRRAQIERSTSIKDKAKALATLDAKIAKVGASVRYRRHPKTGPMTLSQFIASRGGIADTGGEMKGMDLGNRTLVPGHGPLVRAKGVDPDYVREAAVEAGYLPADASIDDLLEAIRRDTSTREARGKVWSAFDRPAMDEKFAEQDAAEEQIRVQEARAEVREIAQEIGMELAADEARGVEARVIAGEDAADVLHDIFERRAIEWESDVRPEEDAARREGEEAPPFGGETAPDAGAAEGRAEAGRDRGPARPEDEGARAGVATEQTPQGTQTVLPGTERSARQAQQAREDEGRGRIRPKAPQQDADEGLFAERRDDEPGMFRTETLGTPGQTQARFRFSPAFNDKREAVYADLRKEMNRIGLTGVTLRLPEQIEIIEGGETVGEAAGHYLASVIDVSLRSPDARGTLRHEIIHALRDMDLFTDPEWNVLERASKNLWRKPRKQGGYDIDTRYAGVPEYVLNEEGIAEAYARWRAGTAQFDGIVRRAFIKIRQFIETLGNALRGNGFQTADDVFSRVESGEVGGREGATSSDTQARPDAASLFQPAEVVSTGPDGRTNRFEATIEGWKAAMDYLRRNPGNQPVSLGRAFYVLRAMQVDDRKITMRPRVAHAIMQKHPDLPQRVWDRLPEMVADPLYVLPHSDGGINVVIDATTASGAPIVVGIRDGELRTITPKDDGIDSALVAALRAGEKIYARDGKVPTEVLQLIGRNRGRGREGHPRMGTRLNILNRDDVIKSQGRVFFQRIDPETADTVDARQNVAQGFLAKGQPIDRALRVPFDWFGGVNEKGEWQPGAKLFDAAENAIKTAKFSEEGPFRWMNGPMEAARAGLIDRYGLDPEYVRRERRLDLDKREIAEKGADILQGLAKSNVGTDEAKVLQAVLTGEQIAEGDMAKLSAPIRQAIDELGAEAVSLGLVSPESYERNRGTYLHRVYMKNEGDQPTLSRWFTNFMTGRRKKIQGDAFKGRGMFLEVDTARAMQDISEFAEGKRGAPVKGEKFTILDQYAEQGTLEGIEPSAPRIERRVYLPADQKVPAQYKDFADQGTWEVRQVGKNKVVLWRDFTKAERVKMGEILDARYTIGKTFMLMAQDLSTGRFYRDIATNNEWTRTATPNGKWVNATEFRRLWQDDSVEWVKVPDTDIPNTGGKKRWGALAGKFVRAEIWRDLNEADILSRPNLWTQLLTQWKLNKALALDTPIPTPDGWTTMGEIKAGDRVFDEKGQICTVLEAKDVQHGRPCYEVAFSDGTKIIADEDHWWFVVGRNNPKGKVLTTAQIKETLTEPTRGDRNHGVPVAAPLDLPDADLPVAPYALGFWLGDGHSTSPRITVGSSVADEVGALLAGAGVFCGKRCFDKRSTAVTFTIDTQPIRAGSGPNGFKQGLKSLDVFGAKRVPSAYLRASVEQRRSLLQGLMDADGWITDRGTCGFATSMVPLRDGVLELLRSLGYKPTVGEHIAPSGNPAWRIHFQAYADAPVARLHDKASRLRGCPTTRQRSGTRQIVAITPVPSVPVRCIAVSSESHLYLAGDGMVPTHNTARSPVVHMNNVMSNMVFMDLADVRAQDLARGILAYYNETADFKEAQANGAFGSDLISQEIKRNVLQPILDDIQRDMSGGNPVTVKFGLLGKLADAIWTAAKNADRGMVEMYRLEDEIFRMAMYMRRRSMGDSAENAANEAREQFLDYDIRAPWVNQARRTVLPFIAYTYRAVPVIARSIATRPWKLAKYYMLAQAASYLAYMMAPGDDDEERRSMREEERGYTWIGVPRMQRMPYRDEYGNPVFLDIRRWIPAGDVFDLNQGHGAFSIPAPIQFGGPIMMGMELALNKSAFTGKEITNDLTDTGWDKARKVGDFLYKSWMPSAIWIPGSWYWEKVGKTVDFPLFGWRESEDTQGRRYNTREAMFSSFGIKLKPQDVESNLEWRAYEFKKARNALRAEERRILRLRDRNIVSEEAMKEAIDSIDAKRRIIDQREAEIFPRR